MNVYTFRVNRKVIVIEAATFAQARQLLRERLAQQNP